MTAVLVTGANGFLGSALVNELLESGYAVRAFVRRPTPPFYRKAVETVVGDIRDPQCARQASVGCDTIVHLAGQAHALDDDHVSDQDYQSVNVDGTKHLLDGAVAGGVRTFIFASSVKVYGETTTGCVDENEPSAPQSLYARSKWMAEQLVASYGRGGSLATLSLRLPLVYGPTEKGNLYRMIAAIDRGRFPPLPRIQAVRSMLHVKNFVLAVQAVLQSTEFLKPMYVVTDAKPYATTEVYDLLRKGLDRQPPIARMPLWALSLGGRSGDMLQTLLRKSMPFSSATLEKLMGQAWYSPEALIRDMGYQPRYAFESAVPELIQHYRSTLL
jgi:UDP-glucose 4-epimerase